MGVKIDVVLPLVPEAFHARFPVSGFGQVLESDPPLVSSAFGRRQVGLGPTKLLVAREKTSGIQGNLA